MSYDFQKSLAIAYFLLKYHLKPWESLVYKFKKHAQNAYIIE